VVEPDGVPTHKPEPAMPAFTTRSRTSFEYGRPIYAGLLPSLDVESEAT